VGGGAEEAGGQPAEAGRREQGCERGKLRLGAAPAGEIAEHALGARAIVDNGRGGDAGVEWSVGQFVGHGLGQWSAMTATARPCRVGSHFLLHATYGAAPSRLKWKRVKLAKQSGRQPGLGPGCARWAAPARSVSAE